MKKEQIKQILIDNLNTWGYCQEFFDLSTDAILALPLEVPDNDWVRSNCPYSLSRANVTTYTEGATDMRDEIIKRNTKP